jgi:hypothetical protein
VRSIQQNIYEEGQTTMTTPATLDASVPPFPTSFAPPPRPRLHPNPEPPVRLRRLIAALVIAVAAFDICFWKIGAEPGLSLGVFFVALAGCIRLAREKSSGGRSSLLIVLLLLGAATQTAIETGITNTLVLLILTVVLAGHTYFGDIGSWGGRWLSQVVALILAPGRPFWLAARLADAAGGKGNTSAGTLFRGLFRAIPALVLVVLFGSLLAAGNAIFSSWTGSFFNWIVEALESYLDFGRIMMWVLIAFVALPFLRPARISEACWKWTENIPRWSELDAAGGAFFSSAMVLGALNVIFLVANVADATFLWYRHSLPAGVSYHDYVHEGVNALIVTVILSAIVLAGIFQQVPAVANRRELKLLSYMWILQNLFLMISVAEKLRRYILAYEMTTARLSCLIFLLLIGVGLVLLTAKIAHNRSLSWLIGGCALAVFVTFYTTQFLNLAGWSADYNVARMEKNPAFRFDSNTMCRYGPAVWPALRRARDLAPNDGGLSAAWQAARNSTEYREQTGLDPGHWRELSLRASWNRGALEEK